MIFLIAKALALLAIVLAFFSTIVAWVALLLPAGYLLAIYCLFKGRGPRNSIPELSPRANELLVKFPHFYANPFANRTISGAAGTFALAGVIVAVIGCYRGFWWGLLMGLVNLGVMTRLANAFEPTKFLRGDSEKEAHNEIMTHFGNKARL